MATAASRIGQYALPASGAPRDPGPRMAPNGQMPSAIVMHHTSDNLTPQQIVRSWQTDPKAVSQRIGSQYIVQRDGTIVNTLDLGHKNTNHTRDGTTPATKGIGNRNTVGFEVIAKNDKDVTKEQIEAVRQFIDKNYPDAPLFGHGQVDPSRKEADEGMTAVNAIKSGRAADEKMASISENLGGAEGASRTALAELTGGEGSKQFALPGGQPEAPVPASLTSSEPLANQYALPKADTPQSMSATLPQGTDPMTAGDAPSKSAFNYQSRTTPELRAAIENTANQVGVHPSAIAGMIGMESQFDPRNLSVAPGGTEYRGLTQMQQQTFREQPGGKLGGMTWQEYQNAKPEQQAAAYGDWLKYYGFQDKAQAAGVNLSEKTPAQQNAYLQGFQFGPNATSWQKAYGQGREDVPTTPSQQAQALRPETKGWKPTMETMTEYFDRLHGGDTKLGATAMAKAPKVDLEKAFETAAAGAGGDGASKQFALPKTAKDAPTPAKALEGAAKALTEPDKGATTALGAAGAVAGAGADLAKAVSKPFGKNMGYDQQGVLREITGFNDRGEPVYAGASKEEAPKVETQKQEAPAKSAVAESKAAAAQAKPLTSTLGSGGDARMDAQMQAIKAMPGGPALENMPAPATPEPTGAMPNFDMASPLPPPPGYEQPTVTKGADLPEPSAQVPKIEPPPINEAANAKLADAFGTPAWAQTDATPQNLYGETPNATGQGANLFPPVTPPSAVTFNALSNLSPQTPAAPATGAFDSTFSLPASPTPMNSLFGETPNLTGDMRQQLAELTPLPPVNVNPPEQKGSDLEINPSTPATGGNAGGGGGGGGVDPMTGAPYQLADGRTSTGIFVPPVHTPLDFSAITSQYNAPVNPLSAVNMSSPAFWFGGT